MSKVSSGRASQYPLLRFSSNVDWQHVDPALLQKLSVLAARNHKIIDVFSGYRTDKYSAQVGGFAGDPHTRHIAVDANIDGKPIGSVIAVSQFASVGLITGNQPNFYKGKRDPSHVQLGSSSSDSGTATSSQAASRPAPAAAPAPTVDTTQTLPTPGQTQPTDTLPDTFGTQPYQPAPGSGMNSTNPFVAQLWNRIQATSPDTQLLQSNSQLTGS